MISLNGVELEFKTFPNGETLVNGLQIIDAININKSNKIVFKNENDSDLVKLMFVKRYLDDRDVVAGLVIYYMPYSRMDRVEGSSVFTLKYVSEFINSLNFKEVVVVEPHSDVSAALLNKATAIYPTVNLLERVAQNVGFNKDRDYLFFPDQGAAKRYSKVKGYKQLVGFKERDFATGKITSLQVVGETPQPGFKVIILDDLCSYGGTFLMSGNKLRELGASEIHLLVVHCEDSIHEGKLLKKESPIDHIFTTNSILSLGSKKITTFQIS